MDEYDNVLVRGISDYDVNLLNCFIPLSKYGKSIDILLD